MNNLAVFNFNNNQVRIITKNNEPWFVVKDLCKVLGISKHRDAISRLDEDEKGITKIETAGGVQGMAIVSQFGVRKLLVTSRKSKAQELAQSLGFNDLIIPTKEAETIGIIKNAFVHLKPVEQFFILGYRIDLYFPEQSIAVECDENHHNRTIHKERDITRQDVITKALGCKWVRYSPHDKYFCIGKVINQIMQNL